MVDTKAANLRDFFDAPINFVTRERIFFNRLSFDLKIAAARMGYHLHLYEPDVDRDGFDFIVEDEDRVRWFQMKSALSGAATANWDILAGLLRPSVDTAEAYGRSPVEAGRGGGVVLITIDDTSSAGAVSYRYTDFDILAAIAEGYLVENLGRAGNRRTPGRPRTPARVEAANVISALFATDRAAKVSVNERLFVAARDPDELLGLMGMRTDDGYGAFTIHENYRAVQVGDAGRATSWHDLQHAKALETHMKRLCEAQPLASSGTPRFDPLIVEADVPK